MAFKKHKLLSILLLATTLLGCFSNSSNKSTEDFQVVNIYTDRHYPIDDTIYKTFENEYNIKVNVVKGKSEDLLSRIDKEGSSTKADLFITADIGRLFQAKKADFFKAINPPEELVNVPDYLYDEEGYWFGLTKRARVIVYAHDRISSEELSTYEDLMHPKWKGKIAVRSKENVYNQSLLAGIIAANGSDKSLEWVKGIVDNMYQSPKGNDRDQVKAVYAGKADIAIVNTYYIGQMLYSDDQLERKAAQSVTVFYPNQDGRGAHINVSGGGVLKHAKNAKNAEKLLAYLLEPNAQKLFAQANYEFPVNKTIPISHELITWGEFKEDKVDLNKIGQLNTSAIKLFDKGGWK